MRIRVSKNYSLYLIFSSHVEAEGAAPAPGPARPVDGPDAASHPAPEPRSDFDHYGCSKCKKKPHGCAKCKAYANQGHAGYFWLNDRQVARKIPTV